MTFRATELYSSLLLGPTGWNGEWVVQQYKPTWPPPERPRTAESLLAPQSMETAPKDGTVIRVQCRDMVRLVRWAWGGGWGVVGRFPLMLMSLNDEYQPTAWEPAAPEIVEHYRTAEAMASEKVQKWDKQWKARVNASIAEPQE